MRPTIYQMTARIFSTYICLIIFLIFTSCKKDVLKPKIDYPVITDTIPHIKPSQLIFKEMRPAYKAKTKRHLEKFVKKNWSEKNHFSFIVAKNGEILHEAYQGFANIKTKQVIDSATPLHIASVSKVITATAILILTDAKRIALEQKVNTILPTFPYADVSVQDLLSHRSGLRNYAYFTEEKGVWNRKTVISNADILRLLSEKNLRQDCPADRRFCYCNTNYAMLALIIEKKTGTSYKEAIRRMIFAPLGMTNSFVFEETTDKKKVSKSYKGSGVEIGFDYLDAVYGDKNIYSTPRDLIRFDLARNAPTFLNADLRRKINQGYSNERQGTKNYGLGIRMINFENGQNFYFHNGWWHGNTASFISLQKEHVTIIALSNKFSTLPYRAKNLAKYFGNYPFVVKDSVE